MRRIAMIAGLISLLICLIVMLKHQAALAPAVNRFHEMYNNAQFDAIWEYAHPENRSKYQSRDLKDTFKTKELFIQFMMSTYNKLGKVVSYNKTEEEQIDKFSWTEKVTVIQRTVFENGEGTESFVFELIDHKPLLVNYELH